MATTRFEARVETDVLAVIRRAAEIQGRTMSDFVVSAAREAAQRAISDADVIRLSVADSERFAAAILSPAKPTDALQRALGHHDQLLRNE
ncbi:MULTISPECIES: DUF1778 domain-containing protein [Burkholderia cepacia complex]|uniref:type II toxin-antitoxin system TacA family antitoxin n=1 Tax=Burkholderia cepacia complex TaxID=87882 RepID=UPI0007562012|nr:MULTISPECIES: DUF1778 domain-containing protein [Burkholderia cepacia complex]KWF20980.1 hypothetical protein WL84_21280 [Burkholderia cenocepacia]MBJ9897320.1 DUF1778 domain-containing protein [Burkholderia cenocepacia]MBJ9914366.1 DUF1778 domain-containing protein [Burkholderia cenocepacia]MBN3503115.1 DUF1778 domain-containing protein [Burkholderia cenocepacia]MBR8115342.1 DUF1778 domain-containing protein [Burkholderia cenocepacia]